MKSDTLIIHLFIGLVIFLGALLIFLVTNNAPIYFFYFAYLLLIITTVYSSGLISFGSIFIYGFTAFVGSKILLSPFNLTVDYFIESYSITEETNMIITGLWVWVLYLFLFGYNSIISTKQDIPSQKVGLLLKSIFVVAVALATMNAATLAVYVSQEGYQALYESGTGFGTTVARASSILFLSLITYKNPRVTLKLAPVILLLAAGYFITGVRANALILILFVVFLYYDVRGVEPKISSFVIGAVTIVSILMYVQWYRQGFTWTSDLNLVEYIITSQNKTFYLPGILIESNALAESKYSVLSILSNFVCTTECTSGDILSQEIMGELYYEGHGVGGIGIVDFLFSFMSFPLGSIIVFVLGILVAEANNHRSKYLILFPLIFLSFYSHRSNAGYYIIMAISFFVVLRIWVEIEKKLSKKTMRTT